MRKAFTIVEFMVAMSIMVIAITAIYSAYTAIYKGYRREVLSPATQVESIIALETIRQDVEHAGYGFGREEYTVGHHLPIEVVNSTLAGHHLFIRSTYNTSNSATHGWAILNCTSGKSPTCLAWENFPFCEDNSTTHAVLLHINGTIFGGNETLESGYNCNGTAVVIAYPCSASCANNGNCTQQSCNTIEYYLYNSTAQSDYCSDGETYMLARKVNGTSQPLIDCVRDFRVMYEWGSDGCKDPTALSPSLDELKNNLKEIYIYILLKEGKAVSWLNGTLTTNDNCSLEFPIPEGRYRWRIVKLAVEPMNLKGQ